MGTSKHVERERKFDATHVSELAFQLWCERHHHVRRERTNYPDHYYRRGDNVIRHRYSGGAGELTVKQRKHAIDSEERVEIDLRFGEESTLEDVKAFIEATGWEHELTLVKNFSVAYWFNHQGAVISVGFYEVYDEKTKVTRRMIEIEVEKGSEVDDEMAHRILGIWCSVLSEDFHLSDPLNDSLYEIYTGKRYPLAVDRSL